MSGPYEHPYPNPELAETHPFVPHDHRRHTDAEIVTRARAARDRMAGRRSVRMLAPDPVPLEAIEACIEAASTAPSGAHQQPWRFVVTGDADIKRRLRLAAEEEERTNYLEQRMNPEWQEALAPLGTDWHKEFLEIAPWVVVLFELRHGHHADGSVKHHYYVKESCGIAAGMFVAALHEAGLCTLTHTPSPMAFLNQVFERPRSERPFVVFPIGHPLPGTVVPDLTRKTLDEVRTLVGPPPGDASG